MSIGAPKLRLLAEEAARRGGQVIADRLLIERTIEVKNGTDLVTDADQASEAAILAYLREQRPTDSLLAEESGLSAAGGLQWIIDPLDGTANYARSIPHFCVSVGVTGPQGLLAGAVFDPQRDELFSAAQGQGATLNGRPIKATDVSALDRAMLCTGFPHDMRLQPEPAAALLNRLLRRARGVLRMGATALDLAYVACGRYDGHFQHGVKPWDLAAGALLVTEAGGVVSALDGAAFDLQGGEIIACGAQLASALQDECRAALAELAAR